MNNLARFDEDGIELLIDTETGEVYASQAGYARMSGANYTTVKKRVERLKGGDILAFKTAEILTSKGLQTATLIPLSRCIDWTLADYNQTPTQALFDRLKGFYRATGKPLDGLIALHELNKGTTSKLTGAKREKQIQLAYHEKYGGAMEVPVQFGRIDLLTDSTIYEFKFYPEYKNCLGQLLAYDDCFKDRRTLVAVLFGVPKSLNFDGTECTRVAALFAKHEIRVKFLR